MLEFTGESSRARAETRSGGIPPAPPQEDRLNAGPNFQTHSLERDGCQVDLLVRTQHSLYVIEIKFRKRIELPVIEEVRRKVERLGSPKGLSVRTGLVYQGEIDPAIEASDFFDLLVPLERLLE